MAHKLTPADMFADVARTRAALPDANWNETMSPNPKPAPTPASVSQIVRRQMVDMGIPIRTVTTVERPPGRFATQVHAFDVPSAAEALRTLHPEHPVTEHMNFAMLVSNGQV